MKILSILISALLFVGCLRTDAISIQWTLNDEGEGIISYKVYTAKDGLVATVNNSTSRVSVDTFLHGNRTVFYVTAVNLAGESLPSSRITVQKH